jgi:hypothetical protein
MTTNETPSNIELQSTVTAALERSAAVESTLGVSAHEGVVTLSGSVTDAAERTAARAIAQVSGVNLVSDEIAHPYRGSPPSPQPTTPRSRHRKVIGWAAMNPVSIDRLGGDDWQTLRDLRLSALQDLAARLLGQAVRRTPVQP